MLFADGPDLKSETRGYPAGCATTNPSSPLEYCTVLYLR